MPVEVTPHGSPVASSSSAFPYASRRLSAAGVPRRSVRREAEPQGHRQCGDVYSSLPVRRLAGGAAS
jgi:hypothetical protein